MKHCMSKVLELLFRRHWELRWISEVDAAENWRPLEAARGFGVSKKPFTWQERELKFFW